MESKAKSIFFFPSKEKGRVKIPRHIKFICEAILRKAGVAPVPVPPPKKKQ
jgi:hypothetical protein